MYTHGVCTTKFTCQAVQARLDKVLDCFEALSDVCTKDWANLGVEKFMWAVC